MAASRVPASQAFQRKIAAFCEVKLAPLLSPSDFANLAAFMTGLVNYRSHPPMRNGRTDWTEVAASCGLDAELSPEVKRAAQHGFDAISRWLATTSKDQPTFSNPFPLKNLASQKTPAKYPRPTSTSTAAARKKPGPKRKIVEEQPRALFDEWEDPVSFEAALGLHMRRFGESYHHLGRAVIRHGETFDARTILNWLKGAKAPRSVESFEILSRIEHRYGLEQGYFKTKLCHRARAVSGHDLGSEISTAERRRLAWHLPDNFNALPFAKRQEIVEWVQRVVISGSTDYRRFQAAASKQRYAIRFPAMTYGGTGKSLAVRLAADRGSTDALDIEDPDLLSGVIDAPPRLALEMAGLIRFKTATLTAIGFQRNGVWGDETASQKLEHLGLMFGALAASPDSAVAGRGIDLSALTFGMLVFPGIWDWYLQWREHRRGFYTSWEVDMLSVALGMTREETGWLRQNPELADRVTPVPGLISREEAALAKSDWHATCDAFQRHARNRINEIKRVMRVHRDPFEPIMCVLEAASPLAEYRKITEEIVTRMPDEHRYPRAAAESVRSFLILRFGLHLGLRQKNLRQLLVCPRGHSPTSERRLEEIKRGELRWSEREGGWEVLIPSNAFKNATSSFFGSKPFRLLLPDLLGLYRYIGDYIDRHRAILLAGASDPGTFFVKTVKRTSTDAAYDQMAFYEAWRLTIQRYGIYNPYTGRGAIKGLLPHGPHNVRDVLATHILKLTGSYEQASYAIQDTPEMVRQHYGRFLPQDKAALAARILNEVWTAV